MTSTISSIAADTEIPASQVRTRTFMRRLAGGALIAGPALTFAGMLTSPHQDGPGTADYIMSLARDTTVTQLSALFLHYSNLLTGAGLLMVPLLVRGVRGRVLTLVGTLAAASPC